jgi:AcrR family transcriptional regulator
MGEPRRYHHGDLRNSLVAASISIIREKGSQALTVREAARCAGVAHSASYRHFKNKSHLLAAVSESGFHLLRKNLATVSAQGGNAIDRLRLAGEAYVRFAITHREEFAVMFSVKFDPSLYPGVVAVAMDTFGILLALVRECRLAGHTFRANDLTVARVAWSQVHGIATLVLCNQLNLFGAKATLRFANVAIEAIVTGLQRS